MRHNAYPYKNAVCRNCDLYRLGCDFEFLVTCVYILAVYPFKTILASVITHFAANDLRVKMVYLIVRILKNDVLFNSKLIADSSLGWEYTSS